MDDIEFSLVIPGEEVQCAPNSIPGYGTYTTSTGEIIATVLGTPHQYNRLICVNASKSRYSGETGNVVIGRISEVATNRWKVDVGAAQEANLYLSAVDLPGGEHRIRSEEDQLKMREIYNYNDLLVAEVQSVNQEAKGINLQTRTRAFGKLTNGMLVKISPMNVAKMRQHFLSLECEVDVIIGKNGWIWVYKKTESDVPFNIRQRIVRVANCIKLLDKARKLVSGDSIVEAYNLLSSVPVNAMLREECLLQIKENLLSAI